MEFFPAVKSVYSKYVTFSGRAPRSEYWWFVLFYGIVSMILSVLDSALFGTVTTSPGQFHSETDTPILSGIFALGSILPSLAVSVRRLHDRDKSGWWLLLGLIPLVGAIVLFVWTVEKGSDGANRFGPDPLGGHGGGGPDEGYVRSSIPSVPHR